ncbi:alpha/beta fold hydrolase [Streptomyces zhihengii]|uniref:Alpha/beta hydrolase n=1 Tax=Streptomyces zhihengii TaxID=1818004 RepID=A0ABS2V465_9ACTN|nr:alpha/beta hydrolase [Streptomyces zhihengii]MBM9624535.1 alpha/beta hydrolase [Streptomyces zhihengii]
MLTEGSSDLAPLVFLHQGLGSIGSWFGVHTSIATETDRRTLTYTRHGYGDSASVPLPRPADHLEHEAIVVLRDVLEQLGIARPVLVGHGEGAAIALLYAAHYGKQAYAGLALVAPILAVDDHVIESIHVARSEFDAGNLSPKLALLHNDPEAAFRGWHDVWTSDDVCGWSVTDLLNSITLPVLVIHGQRDAAGSAQADAVTQLVDSPVTRVDIEEATHEVPLSHPEVVQDAVVDFLATALPCGHRACTRGT